MEHIEVDGNRILMVAMEMIMSLFAVLFAFPHVPSRIIDGKMENVTAWYAVTTHSELCAALLELLNNSPVISLCARRPPLGAVDICDIDALSDQLDLFLSAEGVPITCRQMYSNICAVFSAIFVPRIDMTGVTLTRDWLAHLFAGQGLLRASLSSAGHKGVDRSGLMGFCSEQTVAWLQPYFASHPRFFHPRYLTGVCQ